LLGEILADRYLAEGERADAADLVDWLGHYSDHPEAGRIRALLSRIAPDNPLGAEPAVWSRAFKSKAGGEFDAGLSAWRRGDFGVASARFETAWHEQNARSSRRSAAAFWAARARLQVQDVPAYLDWMARAANAPADFYSLLARHMLGVDQTLQAGRGTLSEADVGAVLGTEAGYRAVALLEVGQISEAQQELDQLWLVQGDNPPLRRAVELLARQAGLRYPGRNVESIVAPAALVQEFPNLMPRGGFEMDPALIYALVRTESNFRAHLVSPRGAEGLMQIMPVTARELVRLGIVAGSDRSRLSDPAVNLEVGQRYLGFLGAQDSIHGDLIRVLASYNAGVGGFNKWNQDIGDPLLYIERIPTVETRVFVLQVLGYAWMYDERSGEPELGIDDLATGNFPSVAPAKN